MSVLIIFLIGNILVCKIYVVIFFFFFGISSITLRLKIEEEHIIEFCYMA